MMHSRLSFNGALAVLGLSAVMTLPSGAVLADEQRFDGVTLVIGTWGGQWRDAIAGHIGEKFEALGGELDFVTGSPQANLAQVIAARGDAPFDVMEILDAQEQDILDSDFLQPIDLNKIPNKEYLEPWMYEHSTLIGSWVTQETICYNFEKYEQLELDPPTTYQDLMHPKLAGRVSIPDIASGGGYAALGAFAYAAGGNEQNIQPGLDLINELQALKFWTRGGEIITQFGTGDIYAAVAHAGWCTRARLAGNPVTTAHPVINDDYTGVIKYGRLGIMSSSETVDAAHWFINEFLDAEFQHKFAVERGVAPINREAVARLQDDELLSEMLELDPERISRMLRIDYQSADLSAWNDQWNRSVTQ